MTEDIAAAVRAVRASLRVSREEAKQEGIDSASESLKLAERLNWASRLPSPGIFLTTEELRLSIEEDDAALGI